MASYDLVVIGTGPGGYVCAIRAAQLGMKVAVVEKNARRSAAPASMSAACPRRRCCMPRRCFEEADALLRQDRRQRFRKPKLDLPSMMKLQATTGHRRQRQGRRVPDRRRTRSTSFIRQGQDPRRRQGRSDRQMTARRRSSRPKTSCIATGSDIARLKGIEIDEKRVVSSTGALSLDKVPGSLLIVGAGVIGLELGSVWHRLGAKVTVVEFLDRILPGMDGEVAKQFQRILEKQGFAFKLGAKVTSIDTSGNALKATIEPAAGGAAETLEADVVLVCIGRVPYTDGLGLKEAGIALDNRGRVQTDSHFATV